MQSGVDASKLDLFAESGNGNGFMSPLFELSCSEGKKFNYKKVHDFILTLINRLIYREYYLSGYFSNYTILVIRFFETF